VLPLLFGYLGVQRDEPIEVARAIAAVCAAGAASGDDQLCRAVLVPSLALFLGAPVPANLTASAVVEELARGVGLCARVASAAEQADLLALLQQIFVENDLAALAVPNRPQAYLPGACGGGVAEGGQLVALFRALVINLRPELVTQDVWQSVQGALVECVLVFGDDSAAAAAAMTLASLLNKLDSDDMVHSELSATIARLDAAPGGEARAAMGRAWLTKAVAVRGHSATKEQLDRLVGDLAVEATAMRTATMFGTIAADVDDVHGPNVFSRTTFMHKQRLYAQTATALIAGYRAGVGVVRSSHLVALVHVLVAVPRQVLLNEVGNVWQLMLEALRIQEDEAVVLCVLGLMQILVTEAQERVSENANTVVAALLPLCCANRMQTRIAALECLTVTATLPPSRIFPLAEDVIRGLVPVLDDRKRLVRGKAVLCRAAWFLIGGTA
jgi:hypothetical protein